MDAINNTNNPNDSVYAQIDELYKVYNDYVLTLDDPTQISVNEVWHGFLNKATQIFDHSKLDFPQLDLVFKAYADICSKSRVKLYLISFCYMVNINKHTVSKMLYGIANINVRDKGIVQKWHDYAESEQLQDESIKSIFRLKSVYGYTETPTQIQVQTMPTLTTTELANKYAVESKDYAKLTDADIPST